MIGGIEETSASYEARSAPRSYPTAGAGSNLRPYRDRHRDPPGTAAIRGKPPSAAQNQFSPISMPIVAMVAIDLLDMAVLRLTLAPSQHHSPVGQEHGRTIPLPDLVAGQCQWDFCATKSSGLTSPQAPAFAAVRKK
jgi:hypothetical protein